MNQTMRAAHRAGEIGQRAERRGASESASGDGVKVRGILQPGLRCLGSVVPEAGRRSHRSCCGSGAVLNPSRTSVKPQAPPTDDMIPRPSTAPVGVRRLQQAHDFAVRASLGVVLAAAVFFRVYALDRHGFNSDEAVYAGTAASISGAGRFLQYFPIYRAHPVLFQTMIATVFHVVRTDFAARILSAAFGIGSVALTYAVGARLYGRRAGLFAAALLAVMPYHVIVSRQVLLDGPQVFFTTLVLYCLARYTITPTRIWMLAMAGSLGLSFLTKETSLLVVGSAVTYLALNRQVRVRFLDLIAGGLLFVVMAVAYPLATASGGAASAGGSFVVWQLLRRPNHGYDFYPIVAGPAIGIVVLVTAAIGLVVLRRQRSARETLLLCWIAVPVVFYELWPVKGYQYLLPIVPAVAVLAGRALGVLSRRDVEPIGRRIARVGVIALVLASGAVVSYSMITGTSREFLAGRGGLPGGREAGRWVGQHVPKGAQLMAIGPSMANVVEFYGDRKVWGLSVSSNPHERNPVYQPITNPDLMIRQGQVQYFVWDAYSTDRSAHASERLLRYVDKYHGRLLHTERAAGRIAVSIYEVRP